MVLHSKSEHFNDENNIVTYSQQVRSLCLQNVVKNQNKITE